MALERLDIEKCEDRLQVVLHRNRYDFVLVRLGSGERVLEIGTGLGVFTKELFPKCGNYVGVEYDCFACERARQRTEGKAEIIQADARNLPFGEGEFSFIICLEVIEHLGDWQAGVRNIHRCLRSDGKAIISVPYRKHGGRSAVNEHHLYEPGEGEILALLRQLFSDVEVYYQYFEESMLMTAARKLRLRRLLGIDRIYADLSAGLPHATSRLQIGTRRGGLTEGLIVVVSGRRASVK
ncbi:MAG: class I SAM-dependent methyltransferase [Verrucomicrobiae bacterium]